MIDEILVRLNKVIGKEIYLPYNRKKHEKLKVTVLFHIQIYVLDYKWGGNFYHISDYPYIEYRIDKRPLVKNEILNREVFYGLSKEKIYIELFKINRARSGWYLVDLQHQKYWYFESRKKLNDFMLKNKMAVLVPFEQNQQN